MRELLILEPLYILPKELCEHNDAEYGDSVIEMSSIISFTEMYTFEVHTDEFESVEDL